MLAMSTKGRYATRIMVYLARHANGRPATRQAIADAEGMSPDYTEQILVRLKSGGLVSSHRGRDGGFKLNCDPYSTTVADILNASEGPLSLVPCLDKDCKHIEQCVTREVWREATDALRSVFSGKTLSTLVKTAKEMKLAQTGNYQI